MKVLKIFPIATLLLIAACSKDKVETPAIPFVHNYTGQWTNVAKTPQGSLDFFNIKLAMNADYTGTSDFIYLSPKNTYPQTKLTWEKGEGDSVIIRLHIPAYPNEVWELRGLGDNTSSQFKAGCYSTPNSTGIKKQYGTMVFKH